MPPKRKNLSADVDEKLQKAKVMKKSEPKSWVETEFFDKFESEYKDTIKYDEYMEGGIPSSLLEGLGFTESVQESHTAADDVDDDDDDNGVQLDTNVSMPGSPTSSLLGPHGLPPASSSYTVDEINAMANSGLIPGLLQPQLVDLTAVSPIKGPGISSSQISLDIAKKTAVTSVDLMRTSQRLSAKNSSSTETATVNSSNTAFGKTYVTTAPSLQSEAPKTLSVCPSASELLQILPSMSLPHKFMPKNTPFYNPMPKTVTKGNIMYERMPTGEVVASLIRKPPADSSGKVHQGNVGGDLSNRVLQSSFQSTQPTALHSVYPEDCPINEYNVGEVLEKSIKATQSMRMLLTSLRDDLRRIGAGDSMVTKEQIRKRQEVADKLTKAYTTYKRSIEDIESPSLFENVRTIGHTTATVTHRLQKQSEATRPVVVVKNDAAVRSDVLTKPRQNTKSNANADQRKLSSQDREVIELSESDEESISKNLAVHKELGAGEETVTECSQRDLSGSADITKAEILSLNKSKIRGKNENLEKVQLKDKSDTSVIKQIPNVDTDSSDCNGHEKVKVEK